MTQSRDIVLLERVLDGLIGQDCSDAILANGEVLQLEFGTLAVVPDSPRGVTLGEHGLIVGDGSWELQDADGETLTSSEFIADAAAVEQGLDAMQGSVTEARVDEDLSLTIGFVGGRRLTITCDVPTSEPCWELFLPDHTVFTAYPNRQLRHGRSDV